MLVKLGTVTDLLNGALLELIRNELHSNGVVSI